MKRETGRAIRRAGLILEMLCIVWMIMLRRQMIAADALKGIDAIRLSQIGLAVGFAVWITGTAIMHWPRTDAKPVSQKHDSL